MRKGELFDYLTEKVALTEKETRYLPAEPEPGGQAWGGAGEAEETLPPAGPSCGLFWKQ